LRASTSLLALALLVLGAFPVSGQSIIPVIVLSSEPVEQFVNLTGGPADAVINCTLFVEGLPLVRYRVNLTATCEGWEARCEPSQFVVTGTANEGFRAIVTVPADATSSTARQVEIWANVSTTGVPLATCATYALVGVWPVYGLSLSTGVTELPVNAGGEAVWPFTIQNTGNGWDTFGTTVVNPASFQGWSVSCNRTSGVVDVNRSYDLKYTIKPPAEARNQTLVLQIKAFSRGASFKNLTVEKGLELSLTVKAATSGGDAKRDEPKKSPGAGAAGLGAALAVAALLCALRRK